MHEVRVYDSSGNLKKVISVKKLNQRSEELFKTPSLYRKSFKKIKSPAKAPDVIAKAKAR